jgi:fatty acid desaturase
MKQRDPISLIIGFLAAGALATIGYLGAGGVDRWYAVAIVIIAFGW